MKNKKTALEKKIFILFFVVTFLLILILIAFQWQIIRYGIKQHEESILSPRIVDIKMALNSHVNTAQIMLSEIADKPKLHHSINNRELDDLAQIILANTKSLTSRGIYFFSEDKKQLYGENWEMITQNLDRVYRDRYTKHSFYSLFGRNIYQIVALPVISETDEFLGMFILSDLISIATLNLSNQPVFFAPVDEEVRTSMLPEHIRTNATTLNSRLQKMHEHNKTELITNLSIEIAVGLVPLFNLNGEPIGIFITTLSRDINKFAHQNLLFFFLVLLSIAILIISFTGAWFGKTILAPVKKISTRMQEIKSNPELIGPMDNQYRGVLGEMIDTFNDMNYSINNYNRTLIEYKTITENLGEGVVWMDKQFKILLYNSSFKRITDIEYSEDIKQKLLTDLIPIENEKLADLSDNGLELNNLRWEQDDKIKYLRINLKPVIDHYELRYVCSILDITKEVIESRAREKLELALLKSNKLAELGRRVEGIVHNINSPLNTVLGYAQILKRQEKCREDTDKIISAGKIISHNVKSLLKKIREDSIASCRPVNVNDIVKQELDFCKHNLYFKHNISLETFFDDNIPDIDAVHSDISLIIANLLNNAAQAVENSEDKSIYVTTKFIDEMIAIEICDTGIGIEEENRQKIFEPFFSTKSNRANDSFGLGLAISKSIAEKYHGRIELTTTVGVGSTFTLCLPFKELK
jgi:signal transduction histidine kinase